MSRPLSVDQLADLELAPGDKTVGTLMFTAANVMEFVLQPETWPVFEAWYRKRWPMPIANPFNLSTEGRAEMEDMRREAFLIGISGLR